MPSVDRGARRLPTAALHVRRRPVVLMYHAFSAGPASHDPYDLHVDIARFEDQLDRLAAAGWRALDLDGYARWRPGDPPAYLVTLDDGFRSALDLALPVLARRGLPSVWFLPVGLLGATSAWLPRQPGEPLLAPADVTDLLAAGAEVGGHSWDHPDLRALAPAGLLRQVDDCRSALADLTGRPPRAYAYPYGLHDEPARSRVLAAGHDLGFAIWEDVGRAAVSRVEVSPTDTWTSLRVKLLPGYRRAWRAAGAVRPVRAALRRAAQSR